jgi:hypothetical protein
VTEREQAEATEALLAGKQFCGVGHHWANNLAESVNWSRSFLQKHGELTMCADCDIAWGEFYTTTSSRFASMFDEFILVRRAELAKRAADESEATGTAR